MATLPPTEPAMWRKLLAAAHPDRGGDHELFIWAQALRESVCEGSGYTPPPPPPSPREGSTSTKRPRSSNSDTILFDVSIDFEALTLRALNMMDEVEPLYGVLLLQLRDCAPVSFGPLADQQERGASYKQLAAIGHRVGMDKAKRVEWYRIAERIPLSMRHAGHILSKLQEAAA